VVELREKISSKEKTHNDVSRYRAAAQLNDKLKLIISSWSECKYILDKDADRVSIVPLYASSLSKELFKFGKKILLMSATIIDPTNFAKSLGIEDYKFIEAKSTFDSAKSPIYISSKYKLNYKTMNQNLPKVCKLVQEICDHHKDDKGVIHTHTGSITSFMKENLAGSRFLYRQDESNNEQIIEEHIKSKLPTVVVSPSLTHGVDLKHTLARFQIIVKLPYLPLNDKRIKHLFNEDSSWYTNKMLSSLVQACGRGVRSEDDWCNTYILDGGTADVIRRSKSKLPKYFLDRVQ
jgi:Rad3-related DNA helicase